MNGNMIQVIALLEKSGKEALNEALNETLDETLNKAAREAFVKSADYEGKSFLFDFPGRTLSKINETFISKFIQVFLQIFYGTEGKPRRIDAVVSSPIHEPLMTGLEQLRMANKTVSFSEKNMHFRIERLRSALFSLDRARSLASEEFEIALVDLLRGLCTFELPGGTSETIVHLTAFQVWAYKEIDYLVSVRKGKQRKVGSLNAEMEDLEYSFSNLKSVNNSLHLALQQAQYRAQCLRTEINEITLLETKILDTLFYVTFLVEVAQKKMIEGA